MNLGDPLARRKGRRDPTNHPRTRVTIFDRFRYGRVLVARIEGYVTEENWRNRKKWDAYEAAVNKMVERTSTYRARGTLVEANNKRSRRQRAIDAYNSDETGSY